METDTSSIKFIRMKNGEDLISDITYVEKEDHTQFFLYKPLKVVYMMQPVMASSGPGYGGARVVVSLVPWIMGDLVEDNEFEVQPEDILLMAIPKAAMTRYYVEFHKANPEETEESPQDDVTDLSYYEGETIDMSNAEGVMMLNKLIESRSEPS